MYKVNFNNITNTHKEARTQFEENFLNIKFRVNKHVLNLFSYYLYFICKI